MKRFWFLLGWLAFPWAALGHVGSPNVFYEGLAGPYQVRVTVRPPGVVPGLADISVRVVQGQARRVTVLPVRWNTGKKGSPPPDEARPVRGENNLYSAQLWLMTSGAYSIFVEVEGAAGAGTTVVPLNSVALTRLKMSRGMAAGLLAAGVFLLAALVSIVGAAVRESGLAPGESPSQGSLWRARMAMAVALLVLGASLYGGNRWWAAVDRDHRNNKLFQPDPVLTSVRTEGSRRILQLVRQEAKWGQRPLVPDHGKLMHLFLVRTNGLDSFAHLHPTRVGARTYETPLPDLPGGDYSVYADVTHETGFTQTLVSQIRLEPVPVRPAGEERVAGLDPDDAWQVGKPLSATAVASTARSGGAGEAEEFRWEDGARMVWEKEGGVAANVETSLRFRVLGPNGGPVKLQPYLDMAAHAVVRHADGSVFTHLHPFGTISMASQQLFVRRERERLAPNQTLEVVCGLPPQGSEFYFPYEFPRSGIYRVWVQVKMEDQIRTAVFDLKVAPKS